MTEFSPRFDTLLDILEHGSTSFRDRPLFGVKRGDSWLWTTYGEFRDEVDRVRSGLAGLGVVKGDVVALISGNRLEWAIAAYAAYGLGAAVVPMYEAMSADTWRYIIGDSGAKVLFVSQGAIAEEILEAPDAVPQLETVISFEPPSGDGELWFGDLGTDSDTVVPLAEVEATDLAGFIYTSGTTGTPKGVLLSHGNLAHNVSAVTDVFPVEVDDRSLSFLPWAHALGQTLELHTVIAMGASTAFAESTSQLVSNLGEVKPTMLVSVPRIFTTIYDRVQGMMDDRGGVTKYMYDLAMENAGKRQALAAAGKRSRWVDLQNRFFDRIVFSQVRARFGGNLKYAISGGAAIPIEVANFIDALGVTVYEGYGLTETSPIATANWPGTRRIGSVGKPIPGVRIEIDDAASADPRGGEIVIFGHNVMMGYHGLPKENAEVSTDRGGFRTGDLGRVDEDGFLYIIGRVKEQYKLTNGKYVVPTGIEEQMCLSPYIANAMVYGTGRPFNVALVVLDTRAVERWSKAENLDIAVADMTEDPRVRELVTGEIARTTEGIPGYERVRGFALISQDFTTENGMLTPTMKVKRPAVFDHYRDDIERLYS